MKKKSILLITLFALGGLSMNAQVMIKDIHYQEKALRPEHSGQNEQARMNKTNTGKELPIAETKIVFDLVDKSWIFLDTIIYTYDANNNLTEKLQQTWNPSTAAWVDPLKYTYTYDANNNIAIELIRSWNGSVWEDYVADYYTYDYDVNNKITGMEVISISAAGQDKSTYTYDTDKNLISMLTQYLDNSIGTWVNSWKDTSTYDANTNNQRTKLTQLWEINGTVWENWNKDTSTYDANNNLISKLEQSWSSNTWMNKTKYTYTYDANNNLTSKLEQSWRSNAWMNKRKYTSTYDVNNNLILKLEQNWRSNIWSDGFLTKYYYKIATGIREEAGSSEQFGVYPNPSSGKFTIVVGSTDIKAISICNALGQVLYQQPFFSQSEILNLELGNSFPTGLYIIQINTADKVYRQKLTKQ